MQRSTLFKTSSLAVALTAVCVVVSGGKSLLPAANDVRPRGEPAASSDRPYRSLLVEAFTSGQKNRHASGRFAEANPTDTPTALPLSPDDPLPGESPEAYRQRMKVVEGYETFVSEARLTGAEEGRLRQALADSQINWRILRRFARHAMAAEEWPDDETRDQAELEAVQDVDQKYADRHLRRLGNVLRTEHIELLLREPRRFGMIHTPLALTFLRFDFEASSI